ncbi:Protein suppressor of forked, partial [Tetrabaena socialis]
LFLRARKWQQGLASSEYGCWRLYADAALLEWRRGHDAAAARNIFEKGLEDPRVFREPQYAMAYLDLLVGMGDVDNARALLARVLADEANARCVALWQRYLAFEGMAGDLNAVLEVERQATAALRGEEAEQLRAALPLIRRDYNFLRSPTDLRRVLGLPSGASDASTSAAGGPPGSAIRPPTAYSNPAGSGAGQEPQPLKQLPAQLGLFINSLPPPHAVEGIVPDVDQVMEALLALDLAPAVVTQVCLDLEAGKIPLQLGPPMAVDQPPYQQQQQDPQYGRLDLQGPPYGGAPGPYGYGQGSPGSGPGGPRGGYPPEPYADGGPPPPGGPDEYGKRRQQYGYDPNEGEDDGYDNGYGGGRDVYHQRLRRRMDQ